MIRPLPVAKQKEFQRWCLTAAIIAGFVIIFLFILTITELHRIKHLKKNIMNLQEQLHLKDAQIQLWQELQQKITLFNNQKTKLQKKHDHFQVSTLLPSIAQSMPATAALNHLSYDKSGIELSGIAHDQNTVLRLMKNLQNIPCINKTDLISLQSQEIEKLQFSIKASMIQ